MYNRQLDVFRRAAELKSFSQTANEMFVSPSAVLQQINNLERNLGCRLFVRSNQGVQLTAEGEYLYERSAVLIRENQQIRKHLGKMQCVGERQSIRIATDWFHKERVFSKIWQEFNKNGLYSIQIVSYHHGEGDEKNQFDLLEGVNCEETYLKKFGFLEMGKIPIGMALSPTHRLAKKHKLSIRDLEGETMISLPENRWVFSQIDDEAHRHQIRTITLNTYDQAAIKTCLLNNYCMHVPMIWRDFISDLVILPVDWDYEIPYGFYYRKDAAKPVKDFIRYAKTYAVSWPDWMKG